MCALQNTASPRNESICCSLQRGQRLNDVLRLSVPSVDDPMDTQHDLLVGRRWRAHSNVVHAVCTHGRVGLTDWFSICCSIA